MFLLVPAVLAGEFQDRVQEALVRGMDYVIRSASDRGNFEEYASDYLFFFRTVYVAKWSVINKLNTGVSL